MSPELRELMDRQEIEDVVRRYARGVDRHDVAIMRGVFHEGAIDNHGAFTGGREAFTDWVNDLHDWKTASHSHNITSHNVRIDGDVAFAESYVAFVLRLKAGDRVMFGSGRYIDRLEKRNGRWAIALRRTMTDSRFEAPSVATGEGSFDRNDPSYALLDRQEAAR